MLSILWRGVAFAMLLPFVLIPIVNFVALPLALYLLVSIAARAWRRNASPQPAD